MSNKKLIDLLKSQEEDRQDLAAGVYNAWQPLGALERELLLPFDNQFYDAPEEIQQQIVNNREAFFAEWGSEGRLAAAMESRHSQERKDWAERQAKINQIVKHERYGGNDGGR